MAYLNELIDSIYSWRKDNKITYDGFITVFFGIIQFVKTNSSH